MVFEDYADLKRRIDDPGLDVVPDDVLVLKNAGPLGGPGMPEWGFLPMPKKLLEQGVRDMVRISDARMSGTAFGTVVLHVAPESAAGGPLALVRDGDTIELDVPNRKLDLLVEPAELDRRREADAGGSLAPTSTLLINKSKLRQLRAPATNTDRRGNSSSIKMSRDTPQSRATDCEPHPGPILK